MDTGRTLLCSAAPDSVDPWRQLKWHLTLLLAGRERERELERQLDKAATNTLAVADTCPLAPWHKFIKTCLPSGYLAFFGGEGEGEGRCRVGMRINLPQFSGFFLCQMAASNGNGPANSISGGEIPKRLPKTARISAPLSAACWREMPRENSAKKFGKRQQKVGREICKLEQGCCSCCWVYNLI